MNLTKTKLLSWNCRGLGNLDKCLVVRNVIRASRCDFVCLQETKLQTPEFHHLVTLLPSYFQRECAYLGALGTAGGCLIAWRNGYSLLSSWATPHSISALLVQHRTGQKLVISNVYGPTSDDQKPEFMEELRKIHGLVTVPWLLVGDFNLVRWLIDRTGDSRNFSLMSQFNELINDIALMEIPLKNRRFTWCSKRPSPSFSKLDRVFASEEWSAHFPQISLSALEVIVSDHSPLLLICKQLQQVRRPFKIEKFWLDFVQVRDRVKEIWRQEDGVGANRFHERAIALHNELRTWHVSNFSDLDSQLDNCKAEILQLDQLEERGNLDQVQFIHRQKLREKAFNLSAIIETRWFQRSRCRWISLGDNNTRFFHQFASSRLRQNSLLELRTDEGIISDPLQIQNKFLQHMRNLLGTEEGVQDFNPAILYPNPLNLESLTDPFGAAEIEAAVKSLAQNKASGPDGLPNEFAQVFWEEVSSDIIALVQGFSSGVTHMKEINRADIRMIPKRDGADQVKDFRPISIINLVPKIISKLLALRLSKFLPQLLSPYQTAFVRGRQISENFLSTREMLQHISFSKQEAVFLKLDFAKEFDTLNWDFLVAVMRVRGFPERWVHWIKVLLSTASSRIIFNGGATHFFTHKRGLRQGDPLSPMLFIIAVDTLQQMIRVLNNCLLPKISRKVNQAIVAFQYADDTALIAHADLTTLVSLKIVLRLFTKVSGLRINFEKSSFFPINLNPTKTRTAALILGCTRTDMLITYLGMPLTIKKPGRHDFQPLIQRIEMRLEGWKAKIISKGGRLQLVNSVLTTIPIYHMACFAFPTWLLNRIEQLCRNFLWGKKEGQKAGLALINWETVIIPKNYGGIGIPNLALRNTSLLLRWWWKAYKEPFGLWGITIRSIRAVITGGVCNWQLKGSFFWGNLLKIKYLFHWSSVWEVGNGRSIAYWFDNWSGIPLREFRDGLPRPFQQQLSLRAAVTDPSQSPHTQELSEITLMDREDRLRWRWTAQGEYTANSVYQVMVTGGKTRWEFKEIWTARVPLKVKLFTYLLLQERILTQDVMVRRGIPYQLGCVLCDSATIESAAHLLYQCRYAQQVWREVQRRWGVQMVTLAPSVPEIWYASKLGVQNYGDSRRKQWVVRTMAVLWIIWKQRNEVVFRGKRVPPNVLAERAWEEGTVWLRCCHSQIKWR